MFRVILGVSIRCVHFDIYKDKPRFNTNPRLSLVLVFPSVCFSFSHLHSTVISPDPSALRLEND